MAKLLLLNLHCIHSKKKTSLGLRRLTWCRISMLWSGFCSTKRLVVKRLKSGKFKMAGNYRNILYCKRWIEIESGTIE